MNTKKIVSFIQIHTTEILTNEVLKKKLNGDNSKNNTYLLKKEHAYVGMINKYSRWFFHKSLNKFLNMAISSTKIKKYLFF